MSGFIKWRGVECRQNFAMGLPFLHVDSIVSSQTFRALSRGCRSWHASRDSTLLSPLLLSFPIILILIPNFNPSSNSPQPLTSTPSSFSLTGQLFVLLLVPLFDKDPKDSRPRFQHVDGVDGPPLPLSLRSQIVTNSFSWRCPGDYVVVVYGDPFIAFFLEPRISTVPGAIIPSKTPSIIHVFETNESVRSRTSRVESIALFCIPNQSPFLSSFISINPFFPRSSQASFRVSLCLSISYIKPERISPASLIIRGISFLIDAVHATSMWLIIIIIVIRRSATTDPFKIGPEPACLYCRV